MTQEPPYNTSQTANHLICTTCGTQFPTSDPQALKTCFICDDPRQFTPQAGQSFTTLSQLRQKHHNTYTHFPSDSSNSRDENTTFTSIITTPKLAIGQRAILIRTAVGNILWDCITLLDDTTISRINSLGGLKAIVISHPHYYTTHIDWARTFNCPVYLAAEDKKWLTTHSPAHEETDLQIDGSSSGVRILKLGGHFPGSLVALYDSRLLIADTLVTTPSGLGNWDADSLGTARSRPEGMNSFVFMWSIPNMIPLAPDELERMWSILKKYEFRSTHGAFLQTDIIKTGAEMKRRVLESVQIQVKYMGYGDHALLKEKLA